MSFGLIGWRITIVTPGDGALDGLLTSLSASCSSALIAWSHAVVAAPDGNKKSFIGSTGGGPELSTLFAQESDAFGSAEPPTHHLRRHAMLLSGINKTGAGFNHCDDGLLYALRNAGRAHRRRTGSDKWTADNRHGGNPPRLGRLIRHHPTVFAHILGNRRGGRQRTPVQPGDRGSRSHQCGPCRATISRRRYVISA